MDLAATINLTIKQTVNTSRWMVGRLRASTCPFQAWKLTCRTLEHQRWASWSHLRGWSSHFWQPARTCSAVAPFRSHLNP